MTNRRSFRNQLIARSFYRWLANSPRYSGDKMTLAPIPSDVGGLDFIRVCRKGVEIVRPRTPAI